jgi:hypothetical protein
LPQLTKRVKGQRKNIRRAKKISFFIAVRCIPVGLPIKSIT